VLVVGIGHFGGCRSRVFGRTLRLVCA
jgi:hypothetical protein